MSRHNRRALTCSCGQPVNGTTLCKRCVLTVDVALANIAVRYADLEVVETGLRGVRYDQPRGSGGSKIPLPFDIRFAPGGTGDRARQQTQDVIAGWVRRCVDVYRVTAPRRTIPACCYFLQGLLTKIATAPWADEFKTNLLDLERALNRVDEHVAKVYCGECTICLIFYDHTPMYARAGDEWVRCQDCGAEYRVEECRNRMTDALEYEWLTAARIADQAAYLGRIEDRDWARKKLNRWHADGFLKAAAETEKGEPVFPFGDACRLLVAAESRRRKSA